MNKVVFISQAVRGDGDVRKHNKKPKENQLEYQNSDSVICSKNRIQICFDKKEV